MSEETTAPAASKKKFELTPSVSILLAGLLIAAAIIFVNLHPAAAAVADAGTATAGNLPASVNVPAPSASDHIIGSLSAPIVLIEYSDFQCPYCQLIYPTLKRIVSESNGQIAWVYRNFPLASIHPQANPAANAAECIAAQLGNDGFWKYVDAVFNNQSQLNPDYSASLAKQFGADMTQYNACVSASTYQSKIDATEADAEANGGQGTPYTIVWSKGQEVPISGALPYDQIMSVINAVKARQ